MSTIARRILFPLLLVLAVCAIAWMWRQLPAARETAASAEPELYFSPAGGCTDAIVRELAAAKSEVLMQAYSFTSAQIAGALVDAHRRGVHVVALLDKSNRTAQYSSADFLAHAGVETLIDARHPIAHNKIMIIDRAIVLTGSFNFTKAAEANAENLLIFHHTPDLAQRYLTNFETHRAHAEVYVPKAN